MSDLKFAVIQEITCALIRVKSWYIYEEYDSLGLNDGSYLTVLM